MGRPPGMPGIGTLRIKTLATTVFTMEQVVLAGEAGCVFMSPFVHEAKAHFDEK